MIETDDELVELLLIPGIGRVKARDLFAAGFKSLMDVANSNLGDLASVEGIHRGLAHRIKEFAEVMTADLDEPETRLETSKALSMCPMCGSLLVEGALSCPNCGMEFEGEEEIGEADALTPSEGEPDGYGFKDEAQIFLCPECGKFIPVDASSCPHCGVEFADEDEEIAPDPETEELRGMLVEKEEPEPDPGQIDDAELFMCPVCGAFIATDATMCFSCGAEFGEEVGAVPDEESRALADMLVEREPEAEEGKPIELLLCPGCGAFVSGESESCDKCGIAFDMYEDEAIGEALGEIEDESEGEPDSPDKKDVDKWYKDETELFMCPECGAFISVDAVRCDNCGMVFEADVEAKPEPSVDDEEVVELIDMLVEKVDEPDIKDVTGIEDTTDVEEPQVEILLCPDCGAFTAKDDVKCPKCGAEFEVIEPDVGEEALPPVEIDDETEEIIESLVEKDEEPDDDEDLREAVGLFMCPNCGAFIATDAEECPQCGATFDKEELPVDDVAEELAGMLVEKAKDELDGHWYKDKIELLLCPECGAFIASDAMTCETCGIQFEGEEEIAEPAPEVIEKAEELDGRGDEAELFLCPACGSFITVDATSCSHCGAEFGEEPEPEPEPEEKPDVDGYEYKDEAELFLCPNCGSFISTDATSCTHCGVVFDLDAEEEPEIEAPVPVIEEEPDVEVEDILHICPLCGAFIAKDTSVCPICSTAIDEEKVEKVIVEPHIDKPPAIEVEEEVPERPPEETSIGERPVEEDILEKLAFAEPEEIDAEGLIDELDLLAEIEEFAEPDEEPPIKLDISDEIMMMVEPPEEEVPDELMEELELDVPAEPALEIPPEEPGVEEEPAPEAIEELLPEITEPEPEPETPEEPVVAKPSIAADFKKRWKRVTLSDEELDEELGLIEEPDPKLMRIDDLLEIDPDDHEMWALKAETLAELDKFDEAVACYDKAAELSVEMEPVYKRRILELLTGAKLPDAEGELESLELAPDEDVERQQAEERITEIDELLGYFPGQDSLLMEKATLLEKLGMHEEAIACFDEIIAVKEKDVEAMEMTTTLERDYSGSLAIGLINGDGRVNGQVNGLVNGQGRVNGRINGVGLVNGRTNGLINGQGRINGLINGMGLVNGRINGLINGRINGLINGRLGDVDTAGLINGMGLVNGYGLVNGRGRLYRRPSARRYSRASWKGRLTWMVMLISLLMLLPMFTNLMTDADVSGISIDGNFNDWRGINTYYDSPVDQVQNSDMNILETRVSYRSRNLDIFLRVDGTLLNGRTVNGVRGMDSIFGFIDIDEDQATGYLVSNLGADLVMDIRGWNNDVTSRAVYLFDNTKDQNDWNGFGLAGSTSVSVEGSRMEARIVVENMITPGQRPLILLMVKDSAGNTDIAESYFTPLYGTLRASFLTNNEPDILNVGDTDVNTIELNSYGLDSEITGFDFGMLGSADLNDIGTPTLAIDNNGNGLFEASIDSQLPMTYQQNGTDGFSLTPPSEMDVVVNQTTTFFLNYGTAALTDGQTVGLELLNVRLVEGSILDIRNRRSKIHNIGTPLTNDIDGAFGDWQDAEVNIDNANDVAFGADKYNHTIINQNIDLRDYRMQVDSQLRIYGSVAGIVMGGEDLPTLRARPAVSNVTPPLALPDTDRDGVPDDFDGPNGDGSTFSDFDNDGVMDRDENGDKDGDGIIDFDANGPDVWLNTTIPQNYGDWSGNNVSRYIGDPPVTQNKGLDYLAVYIDTDDDTGTGHYIDGLLGADHLMLVTGRNNEIVSSEFFEYQVTTSEIPWVFLQNASAELDIRRIEVGVPLSIMGISAINEFAVFMEMSDWKASTDTTDEVVDHLALAPGTRAKPPLEAKKTVDSNRAGPGDYLTYTITVVNNQRRTAVDNVWLNDTLPAGVTYISDTSGVVPVINGNTYSYYFGTIAPRGQIQFTITVQINPDVPDGSDLINDATASGDNVPDDTDSASTTCLRPDITVEKVADLATAYPGDTITYTIYYNNTGSEKAGTVWINDTLPNNVTFVSASDGGTESGGVVSWVFTDVKTGGSNSVTVTVIVDADAPSGTIVNWAYLDYTTLSGILLESSSDSASVVIIPEFQNVGFLIFGILGLIYVTRNRKGSEENE